MRQCVSFSVLAFAGSSMVACSLPAPTTTGSPAVAAKPASFAGPSGLSPDAAAQAYRQAVNDLIAATRVRSSLVNVDLRELERCRFAIAIASTGQSVLESSFDVRQLNLNGFSEVTALSVRGEFVARSLPCADEGLCVSNTGMQIDSLTIVSPTPDDVERARDALRRAQSACSQALR